MVYTKKVWKNENDPTLVPGVNPALEADELNRMENGIDDAHTHIDDADAHHSNANDPTADQKAAMDAASTPSGINAFATVNDIASLGSGDMTKVVYDSNADGKVDAADTADAVAWAGVTGKPAAFAPESHTHTEAEISDLGDYEPAFTKNTAFNKDFGTTSGTITEGDDSRLSDARTPLPHTQSASTITDFDTEVSNNTDVAANTLARHDEVHTIASHSDTTVTGAQLDADHAKLAGIESGADVTDATNVDAAGAVMNSDISTISMGFVVDEDTMVSDSATKIPTQQSVKAYVDTEIARITPSGDATSIQGIGVSSDTPTDGNILVFRDSTGDFELEAKPEAGSNPALTDVTDVEITSVADNDILAYDSGTGAWINQNASEVGFSTVATTGVYSDLSGTPTIPSTLGDIATDTEVLTAVTNVDGAGSGLDADTLDGVEGANFVRTDITTQIDDFIELQFGHTGNKITGFETVGIGTLSLYGLTGISFYAGGLTVGSFDTTGWFFEKDIAPGTDNTYDLGSSINKWVDIYAANGLFDSDVTIGGTSVLDRSTHTGTQTSATISDFDTEVGNHTDVAANTTARHSHSNSAIIDALTDAGSGAVITTDERTKLGNIADGAEVNVNADWNAVSGDALILNKPSTFTPESHSHTEAEISDLGDYLPTSGGTLTGDIDMDSSVLYLDNNDYSACKLYQSLGITQIDGAGGVGIRYAGVLKQMVGASGTTFSADILADNNDVLNAKTVTFNTEYDNGASGISKTIDWNNGQKQKITLTANCTLTFADFTSGVANCVLKIVQDATGSRTVTFPIGVLWEGGTAPTLTTTANAVDILSFYFDGSYYYGVAGLNFS